MTAVSALLAVPLLAADPEVAESGPTGLLITVLLALAVFFLARSMIKHLKRVPPSFDPPSDEVGPPVEHQEPRPPTA